MKTRKTRNINIVTIKLLPIFISAFLLMVVTTTFAQEIEKVTNTELAEINKWDVDADQQLNQEEFDLFISDTGLHGDWDVNYDGIFDDDELYTGFLYSWDIDEDGLISRDEYASGTTEWELEYGDNFNEWDANQDNFLDLEEYAVAMNQTGVFAGWDADEDGLYNKDEVDKGLFDYYDSNDNEFIDEDEYNSIGADFN